MRRAAPSGRWTALHFAAYNGCSDTAAPLLVGGVDQSITENINGCAVPLTAKRRPRSIGPIGAGSRRQW
jgi:hypothetical protein